MLKQEYLFFDNFFYLKLPQFIHTNSLLKNHHIFGGFLINDASKSFETITNLSLIF